MTSNFKMKSYKLIYYFFRRTMDDVMEMMEENSEGKMEFPRDMMMEDCFSDVEEPLFGFVTNVTIPEDMLKPCVVDVECFENGTRINGTDSIEEKIDLTTLNDPHFRLPRSVRRQGTYLL